MADSEKVDPEDQTDDPTPKTKKWSRRKFIVKGGLGTLGVLALGTYVFRNPLRRSALNLVENTVLDYSGKGTKPNLWFEITGENKVIMMSPKVEMGQGTFTGMAQLVADELDVAIDQIEVRAAESDSGVVDAMSTGGSMSINGSRPKTSPRKMGSFLPAKNPKLTPKSRPKSATGRSPALQNFDH